MKKYTIFLLVFITCFFYNGSITLAAPPSTAARGAVLMDAASGRILYSKNPHERMPMASTTKIMTAIIAIEKGNLNDIVTTSNNASGVEGSSIWLAKGEKMTLENLLYGLMLNSGNDAAVAISEHIGGSVEAFIDIMNQKALEIGAKNTHFITPNGLHHDDHYTTAYDLALISSYAMKSPIFRQIVSTKYKKIPWEGHEWDRVLKNNNQILWDYEGGNGIKTGYTRAARRCLASAALRSNMQLVCTVLNCQTWFDDSMTIMDYGFKEFHPYSAFSKGDIVTTVLVKNGEAKEVDLVIGEDLVLPLKAGEETELEIKIDSPEQLKAPVKAGKRVGKVQVRLGEELCMERQIFTASDIEENTLIYKLKKIIDKWSPYDFFQPGM